MEIRVWHWRHFLFSHIQLATGMLSSARIGSLHTGQYDRGVTIERCLGKRAMQTLRKLPNTRPKNIAAKNAGQNTVEKLKGMQPQYTHSANIAAKMEAT